MSGKNIDENAKNKQSLDSQEVRIAVSVLLERTQLE
jgi:hypothetical protein